MKTGRSEGGRVLAYFILAGPHVRWLEERPDIGTSMAAGSTSELWLKIRQAHAIGPALSVDDDRMGATVIAAADDQPARAVV